MSRSPHVDREGSDGGVTLVLLPDRGEASRSLHLTRARLRWLAGAAIALGVLCVLFFGSWGYLALRASRTTELEARVEELSAQVAQVDALARNLEEVEGAYERLRALFGTAAVPGADGLWLPPSRSAGRTGAAGTSDTTGVPGEWPLTEPGFLTQALLEGAGAEHPGIDIAVPAGSYVRAAGAGVVAERGDDPVYGRFLVLQHGDGYRSRYAHNSVLLADSGTVVRSGEVIALSGSTGRSTAPHLHFEVLHEGAPVDPLSVVAQPRR